MSFKYTKADLEAIIYSQLENLNAMNDLVEIMKFQNTLLDKVNKRLKEELASFKERPLPYSIPRKRKTH